MISRKLGLMFKVGRGLALLMVFYLIPLSTAMGQDKKALEIEKTVTELYRAMVHKDKELLEQLTMENLTYGHSSGTLENKSEYINGVLNGAFQFSTIVPKEQTIYVNGSVGVVRHIFEAQGTNNGKSADVRIGCLLIFKKKGQWKLLARQAYKL